MFLKHFHFDLLLSYETLRKYDEAYYLGANNFTDNVCHTYVRLAAGSDPSVIEKRFGQFLDKHIASRTDEEGKTKLASEDIALNLKKVTDIHLRSHTIVAYYFMNKWLQNFAYKTNLSWWVFPVAGAIALIVALLTVSWQSWKAASRNPVEALRYE